MIRHIIYNSDFFPIKIVHAGQNWTLKKTPANQFASAPKD